jgi:hypothetical protein
MKIKVLHNLPQLKAAIDRVGKQARFAMAVALTRTAKDVQSAVPAELERDLDRPTDFTKRGLFITPARRDSLVAVVGFKDRQAKYMALQIAGGVYRPGEAGIRLPGDIVLNSFGNIPRGVIKRLKAAAAQGTLGPAIAKRINANGNRRKGAAPVQLFVGKPQGKGWESAPMGIWRRVPPATPGGQGKLVPVIVFEDKPVTYRKRFDFDALGRRIVAQRFQTHFTAEFQKAIRTAR